MTEQQRDQSAQPQEEEVAPEQTTGEETAATPTQWSNLWQIPTMLLALGLIGLGLSTAGGGDSTHDFDGALTQVEQLIVDGRLELAGDRLKEGIAPYLDKATTLQRGRFAAVGADWLWLSQRAQSGDQRRNFSDAAQRYAQAVQFGYRLSAKQLERWAAALIALDDIEGARQRIADLERLVSTEGVAGRAELNRVRRRLVEHGLALPNQPFAMLTTLLDAYRKAPGLSAADLLWADAREAELQLEQGFAQETVDQLLLAMRRLEHTVGPGGQSSLAELYTLLGRGYLQLGREQTARDHFLYADKLYKGSERSRAGCLVGLGYLALGNGRLERAREYFDESVEAFPGTRWHSPGLLGRAETRSAMGDHDGALRDFQTLRDNLSNGQSTVDISAPRVAQSLVDRHDAALAVDDLNLALSYANIAETLFSPEDIPNQLLLRIAITNRLRGEQIYRDYLNKTSPGVGPPLPATAGDDPPDARSFAHHEIPLEVRRAANTHYKAAGETYVRHARATAGDPDNETAWADSLWMAADSYDCAGRRDLAVQHFREYVEGRSGEDTRRAEAMFRLAQTHHAQGEYEPAVGYYQKIIDEHPLSPFAASSHTPLAQALQTLGRQSDAEQHLVSVLVGKSHLEPEAVEYRDALIAYGRMLHDQGNFARAIEQLDKAVKFYHDWPQITTAQFLLGECYLGLADSLQEKLAAGGLIPSGQDQLHNDRRENLESAFEIFDEVCRAYDNHDFRSLDGLQRARQRAACLSRANAAYELGNYRHAIELYENITRRFSSDPISLTAMIQVVNAWYELDEPARAKAASRQVESKLARLPDDVFKPGEATFPREVWERWLAHSPVATE